jgi:hypothetical protein
MGWGSFLLITGFLRARSLLILALAFRIGHSHWNSVIFEVRLIASFRSGVNDYGRRARHRSIRPLILCNGWRWRCRRLHLDAMIVLHC